MSNRLLRVIRRVPTASLLLPLLALRLLIPAGLMPVMNADGSVSLQVCPQTIPAAPGRAQHAMHQESSTDTSSPTHHHHDGTGDTASSQETACPFTVLCDLTCTSSAATATTIPMCHVDVTRMDAEQVCLAAVIRPQEPRAPPRKV
jgi:hypothetical protein